MTSNRLDGLPRLKVQLSIMVGFSDTAIIVRRNSKASATGQCDLLLVAEQAWLI